MDLSWIIDYSTGKKGALAEYKAEWEATVLKLGDKMFGMLGSDKAGRPILTVKLEPPMGQTLRNTYVDIIPGYYMNKEHWNSILLQGKVPREVIQDLIDQSYELIKNSLTKKAQKELDLLND